MINSFTGLHAGYYDLVYADKPYAEEARFVARRLEEAQGRPPRTLLDLACGTGRHAVEFAGLGIEVTGVDINEELLAHARQRAPDIEFVAQDMTALDLGDARFDAITCLFDSIGYPQTNEGVLAALGGAQRHLAAEGALAVEFLHATAMLVHAAPLRVRRWDTGGGELLRISQTRLDAARQLMDVDYELVDLKPDGSYEHWRESQANRFFSVEEMRALMGSAGLAGESFGPAYRDGGEIDADTFHVLALARAGDSR